MDLTSIFQIVAAVVIYLAGHKRILPLPSSTPTTPTTPTPATAGITLTGVLAQVEQELLDTFRQAVADQLKKSFPVVLAPSAVTPAAPAAPAVTVAPGPGGAK